MGRVISFPPPLLPLLAGLSVAVLHLTSRGGAGEGFLAFISQSLAWPAQLALAAACEVFLVARRGHP